MAKRKDVTKKDAEAVKRLQDYYARRAWDFGHEYITDENFTRWLGWVLQFMHEQERERIQQIIKNDPAFKKPTKDGTP